MDELHSLANLVDPLNPLTSLSKVKVVITHIKDSLLKEPPSRLTIQQELEKINDLSISFIFPEQGQKLEF